MTTYKTNKAADKAIRLEVFVTGREGRRRLEGRYTANQLELAWPDLVLTYGEAELEVVRLR